MASTATAPDTTSAIELPRLRDLLDVENLPPLVHPAMRANTVRLLGLEAIRAHRLGRLREVVMGTPTIAARLGMAVLWVWHLDRLLPDATRARASRATARSGRRVRSWGKRKAPG